MICVNGGLVVRGYSYLNHVIIISKSVLMSTLYILEYNQTHYIKFYEMFHGRHSLNCDKNHNIAI